MPRSERQRPVRRHPWVRAAGPGLIFVSASTLDPQRHTSLQADDLQREVDRLRAAGGVFRNNIVTGVGGKQILVEDPAGNPVELFEPGR